MARRISNQSVKHDDYHVEYPQELEYKEEFRPPSPAPSYTEKDVLSSMLRRLGELEDKVQVLETKPSEMPFEKEELLNAAVRRVDALEAELISTKKVKPILFKVAGFTSLIGLSRHNTNYRTIIGCYSTDDVICCIYMKRLLSIFLQIRCRGSELII